MTRLLALAVVAAAYGWQDRLRGLPGPQVALVLPLRDAGHQAAVPLVGLAALWLLAFAVAARLARPRHVLPAAAVRAALAFAAVLALQAVSLQLVRQATVGFQWGTAAATAVPWIVAACAVVGTIAAGRRWSAV
jgi:hypothetical protein